MRGANSGITKKENGETSNDSCVIEVKVPREELSAILTAAGIDTHIDSAREVSSLSSNKIKSDESNDDEKKIVREHCAFLRAKRLIKLSQKRLEAFELTHLDDPSWHILLDLYVNEYEGREVSVSGACIGSLAPTTTALRHITHLTERGELERIPDPYDLRRVHLKLSEGTQRRLVDVLNSLG
jgi:DNA-binding MarR family transcriptional regulator